MLGSKNVQKLVSISIYSVQEIVPKYDIYVLISLIMVFYNERSSYFRIYYRTFFSVTVPYKVDLLTLATLVLQFPYFDIFVSAG